MNANVSKLLNEQINDEFYSAYLYLDFANYYAAVGLDGFENWYRVQAQEERDHAMLFYQYLQNNGEGVTFEAIAKPEWERGDHMTPLKKHWSTRSWSPPASMPSTPPHTRSGTSAPCRCWTGSSRNRARREKNAADLITKMELFGGDSKGAVYAQQRTEGTGLHRALAGAVSPACLRAFASGKRQTTYRWPAFSSTRWLEYTNYA